MYAIYSHNSYIDHYHITRVVHISMTHIAQTLMQTMIKLWVK
jgi:hypothetical protein